MEQHEKNIVMVSFFICVIVLVILSILSIIASNQKETQASTVRTHTYLKYIDADYSYSQIKYYYDTTTKVMYMETKTIHLRYGR